MRKLILTGVAAGLIIGCAALAYAGECNPGIICVEFGDNVNLERVPGTKNSGHPTLDAIAIKDGSGDRLAGPAAAAPVIRLAQNAPNPAVSTTTIRLELSSSDATRAEVAIYDLSGRKVRTFDLPVKDGLAEVAWDLTSSDGSRVAPGVYIYRVNAAGLVAARKCVVR